MELTVEFIGLARILTHGTQHTLKLSEGLTYRQILKMLGEQYPELVGHVIAPDLEAMQSSNMLCLNGRHMIQPSQMDHSPKPGDRLILMSILAGG